jgi:hypothetical protein
MRRSTDFFDLYYFPPLIGSTFGAHPMREFGLMAVRTENKMGWA